MRKLAVTVTFLALGLGLLGCPAEPSAPADPKQELLLFVDALEKGTPGTFEVVGPFGKSTMKCEVLGKGHFTQELPHNGMLECTFDEERTRELVAYYRSFAAAKEVSVSNQDGVTVELHDGEEVTNPLNDAMENETGEVEITGYDDE